MAFQTFWYSKNQSNRIACYYVRDLNALLACEDSQTCDTRGIMCAISLVAFHFGVICDLLLNIAALQHGIYLHCQKILYCAIRFLNKLFSPLHDQSSCSKAGMNSNG